jgi:RES domain-containing protein
LLECLVHANIGRIPRKQSYVEIRIPVGVAVTELLASDLPGWDASDMQRSRAYGDAWFDGLESCVLLVPSVVTRVERNILIHPGHPDFSRIQASDHLPVIWDHRLFE